MELLLDEHGNARLEDGKPVYRREDGQELAFDAEAAMKKIRALNEESKSHRLEAERLGQRFAVLGDVEDVEAFRQRATEAMATAEAVERGDFVPREDAETLRDQALAQLREELRETRKERAKFKALAIKESLSGLFARSSMVREQLNLPLEAVEAMFRKHFTVKDGRIAAHDGQGAPLFGPGGKPASPEEALEILIQARFPDRGDARVWKGSGGGGAERGAGLPHSGGLLAMTPGQARDARFYRARREEARLSGKPLVIQG